MNIEAARILLNEALTITDVTERTSQWGPIPDAYAERITRTLLAVAEYLQPNLPEIKTCIDIDAAKLEQGQDPRGALFIFKNKRPARRVRWISQHRITIMSVSINGIGLTKLDRARLQLWSMFRMKVPDMPSRPDESEAPHE